MSDNKAYQQLLNDYISRIGQEERPGFPEGSEVLNLNDGPVPYAKGTCTEMERDGYWCVYLLLGPEEGPQFIKRAVRRCADKRQADIMGSYYQRLWNEQMKAKNSGVSSDDCHYSE